MACVVCQHCEEQVFKEDVAVRDGYSYHKKCHKCYVCSETNLHNAEVFKGVIFCCSCSQRIFQGCSTARRSKNGNRRLRSKSRGKRRERIAKDRKRGSNRARPIKGVLEMAHLGASDSSSSNYNQNNYRMSVNALALSTELALQIGKDKEDHDNISKELKKNSIEIGVTTEMTQALLKQMNCPVISNQGRKSKPAVHTKNARKEKGDSRFYRTVICSDLRIAELGASTEIAHMALRKQSEIPVIIKSDGVRASSSPTGLNQESVSDDGNDEWRESSYSLKQNDHIRWLDRRMGSILKMPYRFFKKNVLNRSSLISVAEYNNYSSHYLLKKLKMLFHEEINDHQSRGMKRLYPTINRRKTPYRLGWVNLVAKVSAIIKPEISIRKQIEEPSRCKHFERSHSYRCMRAQVMKLAGPTKSELACLRNKMKNVFLPTYLRNLLGMSKRYPAIMMSQACGSDLGTDSLRNAKSN